MVDDFVLGIQIFGIQILEYQYRYFFNVLSKLELTDFCKLVLETLTSAPDNQLVRVIQSSMHVVN